MPHKTGPGVIFGITSEDGAASQKRVILLDRGDATRPARIINQTVADANGAYVFNGLNPETDDYVSFSLDDDGAPTKAALIQDKIQPIPGHRGAEFPENFFLSMRRRDPIAGYIAEWTADGWNFAPMLGNGHIINASSTAAFGLGGGALGQIDLPSLIPAAPAWPGIDFQGLAMLPASTTKGSGGYRHPGNTGSLQFTMVLWATLETGKTWGAGIKGGSYSQSYHPPMVVQWTGTALEAKLRTSSSSPNSFTTRTLPVTSYVDDGLPHMITVAYNNTVGLKAWVDATLVYDGSGASSYPYYNDRSDSTWGGFYIGGILNGSSEDFDPATNSTLAAAFCLEGLMEQADVDALWAEQSAQGAPQVTGYVREVVVDRPQLYLRLNEGSVGDVTDFLNSVPKLQHIGSPVLQRPSIIAGGNLTEFTGAEYIYASMFGGGTHSRIFIAEWVMNPYSAGAGTPRTIITQGRPNNTSSFDYCWVLSINSSNVIFFNCVMSSGVGLCSFSGHTITHDETAHFAVIIDRIAGTGTLMKNGVVVDTQTVSQSNMMFGTTNDWYVNEAFAGLSNDYWTHMAVGALPYTSGNTGEHFKGLLGEIALYGRPVSQQRFVEHYEARNEI